MVKQKKSDQQTPVEETATDEKIDTVPAADATLAERILWVRDRVTTLGKDSTVAVSRTASYNAISHDKVTAFIRPKMVQAGIASFVSCIAVEDVETGVVTDKGRKVVQHRACFEITFMRANMRPSVTTEALRQMEDFDDPAPAPTFIGLDDRITVRQYAYADDHGDKAPGKATSYAMKYALLKMFMVETGEEDETRDDDAGERGAVIGDDEKLSNDLYALADELFGDDATTVLQAMAARRFFVKNWVAIPQGRYKDACRSLKRADEQDRRKAEDAGEGK